MSILTIFYIPKWFYGDYLKIITCSSRNLRRRFISVFFKFSISVINIFPLRMLTGLLWTDTLIDILRISFPKFLY